MKILGSDYDGTLTHRYVLGVHQAHAVLIGLTLNRQFRAVVGAGGDGGIGQMQDAGIGFFCKDLVIHRLKIEDGAAAGGGDLSGAVIIGANILRRESAVVQRLISQGYVHGDQYNAKIFGELPRNIRAGFCHQNNTVLHDAESPLSQHCYGAHRSKIVKVLKAFYHITANLSKVFEKPVI
jgi:hypothetical protein